MVADLLYEILKIWLVDGSVDKVFVKTENLSFSSKNPGKGYTCGVSICNLKLLQEVEGRTEFPEALRLASLEYILEKNRRPFLEGLASFSEYACIHRQKHMLTLFRHTYTLYTHIDTYAYYR